MCAWQRPQHQHVPHGSLVVVRQLSLDPSVQVPATIPQAAPCHVPSTWLQQAIVESLGAGLVVLLHVLEMTRGPPLSAVLRLLSGGGGSGVGLLQGQEVPLLCGHCKASQRVLTRAEHVIQSWGHFCSRLWL